MCVRCADIFCAPGGGGLFLFGQKLNHNTLKFSVLYDVEITNFYILVPKTSPCNAL